MTSACLLAPTSAAILEIETVSAIQAGGSVNRSGDLMEAGGADYFWSIEETLALLRE